MYEGTYIFFLNFSCSLSLSRLSLLFSSTILERRKGTIPTILITAACAWSPHDEEDCRRCTGVPSWGILHWAAWKKKERDGAILGRTRKRNVCVCVCVRVYVCVCVWCVNGKGEQQGEAGRWGKFVEWSRRLGRTTVRFLRNSSSQRTGLDFLPDWLLLLGSFIRRTVCPFGRSPAAWDGFFARHCRLMTARVGRRRPTSFFSLLLLYATMHGPHCDTIIAPIRCEFSSEVSYLRIVESCSRDSLKNKYSYWRKVRIEILIVCVSVLDLIGFFQGINNKRFFLK